MKGVRESAAGRASHTQGQTACALNEWRANSAFFFAGDDTFSSGVTYTPAACLVSPPSVK